MADTKLLLKISNPEDNGEKWVHLCYVDTDIYEEFIKSQSSDTSLNDILSSWCKEDFGVTLPLQTTEALATFRMLVKNHYRTTYPDVFRDSETDRQGWTRIWVTNKMKEAVENGKVCV